MGDVNKSGYAFYKDSNWYSMLNEGYYGAIPKSGDTINADDYDLGNYGFSNIGITFVNFPDGMSNAIYGILKSRHIISNDIVHAKFQELVMLNNASTLMEYYMRWYSPDISQWFDWVQMHN